MFWPSISTHLKFKSTSQSLCLIQTLWPCEESSPNIGLANAKFCTANKNPSHPNRLQRLTAPYRLGTHTGWQFGKHEEYLRSHVRDWQIRNADERTFKDRRMGRCDHLQLFTTLREGIGDSSFKGLRFGGAINCAIFFGFFVVDTLHGNVPWPEIPLGLESRVGTTVNQNQWPQSGKFRTLVLLFYIWRKKEERSYVWKAK